MKFISWNVNGLRACLKKGFEDVFNTLDADFFCIQEKDIKQNFYPVLFIQLGICHGPKDIQDCPKISPYLILLAAQLN